MENDPNLIQRRPTETLTGFGGALTILICYFAGVDDPVVWGAIGIVIAGAPSAITALVELVRRPG